MNSFLQIITLTGVYLFIGSVFLVGTTSQAQMAPAENEYSVCQKQNPTASVEDLGRCVQKLRGTGGCSDARKEIRDAETKIGEACRKAGMGNVQSCIEKANECADEIGDDPISDYGLMDAAGTITGLPLGSLKNSSASNSCPQLGGQDFFEQKERIEDKIKDIKEEISDLTKESGEIQDNFNKEITELQEAVNDAQKEFDERKAQMKKDQRDQLSEFQNSQAQMKDELGRRNIELIQKRNDISQSQLSHSTKLIAMSDQAGKRACMAEVKKLNDSYKSIASSTARNFMTQAKSKKKDLISAYNDCISVFQKQRIALNKQQASEQERLLKEADNIQSSIDNLTASMATASDNLTQMQNEAKEEESRAEQEVIKMMQLTQQKMTAAQAKMQSDLQALSQKQASLQEALNRANSDLAGLSAGGKPKRGTEYSVSDAHADISTYTGSIQDIINDPDNNSCGLRSTVTGLKADSRSSRNKRGSGSGSRNTR